MSVLSRIPGLGPLAAVLAHTLSIHSNPTLRRYNDILATTFYHHGRFCASNQATVIFLVIVFVGIIAYPGIITSYNASAYARQHRSPASISLSSSSAHPHSSRHHFPAGNLDLFWTQHHHRVITPIWTEDPEIHRQNLPSTHPLGYLAPVIINATQLLTPTNKSATGNGEPLWSEADLLAYAAQIQRRLESIVVDVSADDNSPLSAHNVDRGAGSGSTPLPAQNSRLVRLGDICLQSTLVQASDTKEPDNSDSERIEPSNTVDGLGCLVHTPQIHWDHADDPKDPQGSSSQDHNRTSSSLLSVFGGLAFDPRVQQGQDSASLVFTYFLRGEGETQGQLDVRRAWRLIFEQLVKELHAARATQDDMQDPTVDPTSEQAPSFSTLFATRGTTAHHPSRLGSKRLVSEKNIQPRSNISAEYWLLAMAYFVMFLYISLSVGRVDLVKSKYGLGIAAVATVFVSLLMSIGLCSVFGVTLTLMPWEILPFMIIVVGVENINILVHAVVETSMDLPVRERVGRGLGSVGVSITMTLVAELCLLIVGAMTTIPAVQEFCTFAIAAVIMDYLLQMTFFITVISIDIRRLELSDLSSRPAVPYARYPFGARHPSILKTGPHAGDTDPARFGARFPAGGGVSFQDQGSKHHRSDSATSLNSDGDANSSRIHSKKSRHGRIFTSFLIVGLMTYLGYIYGTTNHAISGTQDLLPTSFWRITSPEASTKFWSTVDPGDHGGYLEIEEPLVVSLQRPSDDSTNSPCLEPPEATDHDHHCEDDMDGNAGTAEERENSTTTRDGQLDPRRPFKLLRNAFVFVCLFAFWLLRVFVVPSIILAAAILLLLSYLLSPQRKLLVDLQWTFPFIVLPGDYQSKRKLMMEELLAQEAKEQGLDPRPCPVIPGTVETLCLSGHETDIDQMDVSADMGLILTSSMDGVILLWDGMDVERLGTPLARLQDSAFGTPSRQRQYQCARISRSKARAVRCLRLDPTGTIAAASFGEGGVYLWRVDAVAGQHAQGSRIERIPCLAPVHELVRTPDATLDASKLKVSTILFWAQNYQYSGSSCAASIPATHDMLVLAGYRDGQIWEWDPVSGRGECVAQTQFRGGIAELNIIELEETVRQELGLKPSTYLLAAGKDGSLHCWTRTRRTSTDPSHSVWHPQWSHRGPGAGISISVLSLDAEVPMVATGYSNGAIKVWDIENGNLVWTLSRGSHPTPGQQTGSASFASGHHDRRSSRGDSDSHQPSHQGAITKLCFHALELEDGLTGAPAPRVWLLISSGLDETVMVWMIEWEGLMGLPLNQAGSAGSHTLSSDNFSAATMGEPRDGLQAKEQSRLMSSRQGSRDWTSTGITAMNPADLVGTLSSLLPAPRLLGFMKQRGGKSITVSNSCLYGVRRKESSSASLSTSNSHGALKPSSHTALLDATVSSQGILRSRRRSDGHALTPMPGSQDPTHASSSSNNGTPTKRGWELWEADLYQCIFKDPGFWSLDLTVRAINLQLHSPPPVRRHSQSASFGQHWSKPTERVSETISVSSNGSGMAVPVVVLDHQEARPLAFGPDASLADGGSNYARPKMHRRPGSFTHQGQGGGGQRGFVVQTGFTQSQHPFGPSTPWEEDPLEKSAPMLLPFVETRLVHAIQKRPDLRPWRQEDPEADAEAGRGSEVKDIVIGFGNFIKIVRLVDEDDGLGNSNSNGNIDYYDSVAE